MNKVRKNKLITKVKSMTNLCAMDRSYVQYIISTYSKKKYIYNFYVTIEIKEL